MGIPTYYLISGLLFDGSTFFFHAEYTFVKNTITAPYYTLLSLTILAWIIELAGIRWNLPNLLGICAFCHAAVGSWWLVNFVIIGLAGWSYIPMRMMAIVLLAIMIPAVIWHITGDIIRAYMKNVLEEIERTSHGLAAAGEAFVVGGYVGDVEMGAGKS